MHIATKIPTMIAVFCAIALAQINTETAAAKDFGDKEIGKGVFLEQVVVKTDRKTAKKTYKCFSERTGGRYLSFLSNLVKAAEVDVMLNDTRIARIRASKGGWSNTLVSDGNGQPRVLQIGEGPFEIGFINTCSRKVPEIHDIRIGEEAQQLDVSLDFLSKYTGRQTNQDYVEYLAAKSQEGPIKERVQKADADNTETIKTTRSQTPELHVTYQYKEDVSYWYTYYDQWVWLNAGETVTFETRPSWDQRWNDAPTPDPVMYLFHKNDPSRGSWFDDDGNWYLHSKIHATIQHSGCYVLLVREYNTGYGSHCDVYRDGNPYSTYVTLYGSRVVDYDHPYPGWAGCEYCDDYPIEHFCFEPQTYGDTRIFVIGTGGKVIAHNDDYWGPGDYNWGLNSRAGTLGSQHVYSVLVSGYGPNDGGMADVYYNVEGNKMETKSFPDLHEDDAMTARYHDPSTGYMFGDLFDYNCISWTGATTWEWFWPPKEPLGGPWYVSGDPKQSFDNYYGNTPQKRYSGAWNYVDDEGVNDNNAVIDLWRYAYRCDPDNHGYSHATIRRPGNGHPHGYAWESKHEVYGRQFHPRDAVGSDVNQGCLYQMDRGYGQRAESYRHSGYASDERMAAMGMEQALTFEESRAAGLSVLPPEMELNSAEKETLWKALESISPARRKAFQTVFNAWKATWHKPGNLLLTNRYKESNEYRELMKACGKIGDEALTMVFKEFLDAYSPYLVMAISELTWPEYHGLYRDLINQWRENNTADNGAYIVYSNKAIWTEYVKTLLCEVR